MMHSSNKILTTKTEVKDLYSNHNISSYPQIKDIGHTVKNMIKAGKALKNRCGRRGKNNNNNELK